MVPRAYVKDAFAKWVITMKQIRNRLVALVESHDENNCPGCSVCEEIKSLRKQIGFEKRQTTRRKNDLAKLEMTVEEFVDLRFVQKLTYLKIAKLKGVSDASVHLWKDNNKEAIAAEVKRLNINEDPKPKIPLKETPSVTDSNIEKYKTEIRQLKERLVDIQDEVNTDKLAVKKLQAKVTEYEDLLTNRENAENELARLRTENQAMRELLRLWM